MNISDYQRYVSAFNSRDYASLLNFFTDDVILEVNGQAMRGKEGIVSFYDFFHDCVRETVSLQRFFEGEDASFAEVLIRFEGLKELTADMLAERGYDRMTPVPVGASFEIEFFIIYEQNAEGLINRIKCSVFEPVVD